VEAGEYQAELTPEAMPDEPYFSAGVQVSRLRNDAGEVQLYDFLVPVCVTRTWNRTAIALATEIKSDAGQTSCAEPPSETFIESRWSAQRRQNHCYRVSVAPGGDCPEIEGRAVTQGDA